MKRNLLYLAGLMALSGAASASPADSVAFEQRVSRARAEGAIDLDRYFLERFNYVFAPQKVDPRFLTAKPVPVKNTTGLIAEYERARARLRPETVRAIDAVLAPTAANLTYDTTRFHFTYSLTGQDAVPSTDTDANGIPDFVQNLGVYAEYCYQAQVVQMGFTAPYLSPANNNKMPVSFKNQNSYAYTQCPGGTCVIVFENDFAGFPGNDDPEGAVAGASKVTFAHEYKHTIQYATSRWSEGGWVELDATWMEDQAYPYVNDYVSYVNTDKSQIIAPADALDTGGSGSYYDAIWQTSMSERFSGVEVIVDFWDYRATHQTEDVLVSYDNVLAAWGSSLVDHFEHDYFPRNYRTGSRATTAQPAYTDAYEYKDATVTAATYPVNVSNNLEHLAGQYLEVASPGSSASPVITLTTTRMATVGLVVVLWDKNGGTTNQTISISNGKGSATLSVPWSQLSRLGLVVTNAGTGRRAVSYTLSVK